MDYIIYYGLTIVGLVIVSLAQGFVQLTYRRYCGIKNKSGMTGAEAARKILKENGLENVYVVEVKGFLTDHYDPSRKVVRLSTKNYNDDSVGAVAVASHECGHALQDKENYKFMRIRAALVPVVNFSSKAGYVVIMIGIFSSITNLIWLGVIFELMILLFQIVTLPVEIDASKRAMAKIKKMRLLTGNEVKQGRKMLIAAALTYVASVASAILEILRLVLVFGNDRD